MAGQPQAHYTPGQAQHLSPTLPSLPVAATLTSAKNRILRRKEHLFHAGEPLSHPYRVMAGVFKSYVVYEDGSEQVLGFHLPGDLIGFDAMVGRTTFCAVMALDTASVRQLTTAELASLYCKGGESEQSPSHCSAAEVSDSHLHSPVIHSMYDEILRLTRLLHMERGCSTTSRLASFLLEYAEGQSRRGGSRLTLHLPMKRRDLAGYLGLATETLSRAFSQFRDQGLLAVNTSDIEILNLAGLEAIAAMGPAASLHSQRNSE
ncbi:MAG: hypothetical protein EA349_15660 [Halomonadaceae bacterium]|nr:MAG: hypothetical protein EA349_15660 [Halomonadaceae bacterium]